MAASNSTEGQRSEKRPESPNDTAPEVVPTPSEKEAEELRKKKRAQLQEKASANPEGNTDEGSGTSEPAEPVDPEPSSTGANEPAHFVAELAVVSMHVDLDHEMSDAPPLSSYDTNVAEGPDPDVEMEDAPPLYSLDTNVPEGNMSEPSEPVNPEPSSTGADEPAHFVAELAVVSMHVDLDHEMSDAPPLSSYDTNVPEGPESVDVEMVDAPPLQPDEE